jgi:hypothetical protein
MAVTQTKSDKTAFAAIDRHMNVCLFDSISRESANIEPHR